MYSIVLMMALNAGGESLDCHRNACSGGTAYVGSSCHGGLFQSAAIARAARSSSTAMLRRSGRCSRSCHNADEAGKS